MKKESFILFLLAFINFVNIVDVMIIMPLGEVIMTLFEISPGQFSILVSAYTTAAGVSGFLGVFFIDKLDRKLLLLLALVGFSIGTFACAISTSYLFLVATRAFTGLFGGLIGALVLSIVSDVFVMEKRGKAMGILMAAFSVASVIGVPLSLFLANKFTWQTPFYFLSVLGLVAFLLALRLPQFKGHILLKAERTRPFKALGLMWKDKNQRLALSMGLFLILGHFSTIPFVTPFMTRNIGFSQEEITYIYLLGGGFTVFTSPLIGKLTDRFKPLRMFRILIIASFVVTLILTSLETQSMAVALTINTIFFVFVSGRMIPAQTLITGAVGSSGRGSFMSIKSSLQQLAAAIASIIGGLIVVENADGTIGNYWMVGIFAVVVSSITLFIAPKLRVAKGN
ncbi:MAG: DHA1 family inner membrane transport protein [Flavobacteriales bacterium]|jgi:DHA1 family inner membrane transport protein